ncbi:MAG: BMP family ABC transporter substrate-binding protein [Thermoprotei archaeon]|nr:MAG: BMP family ABC transporter substrate-binding protein [Thermoprotei archaeon]RLE99427.1 MAG: BMP family ABC transporter substrate-binding protein [Thermoprotei archaeon]
MGSPTGLSKYLKIIAIVAVAALLSSTITWLYLDATYSAILAQKEKEFRVKKLKAAWIFVGPVGDYGWTYGHYRGMCYVNETFDWLEVTYIESVSEGDCLKVIEKLISEGYQVIFTTSYGYMDPTLEAAKKYPSVIFFHCSGYKRYKNMGTYFADLYQIYYLNGLIAGALTKTNKIGYVAAHLIPEVIRHINAFTIGVNEVNPDATVYVIEIGAWYDPAKAREAAKTLIDVIGCDVLAFTEDSPTVVSLCEEYYKNGKPVYVFAHYSPMLKYGPNVCVSGQLVHWEVIYQDILMKIYLGIYNTTNLKNVDYWWLLKEGAVELGCDFGVPINPKFVDLLKSKYVEDPVFGKISVYDLVFKRLEQMKEEVPTFDPFTGPLYDTEGNLKAKPGERLGHDELWSMTWFVKNVVVWKGGGG